MTEILVVDDSWDNLNLLESILEEEGYDVELIDNGTDALAYLESSIPDLILLDVMMPGISGYEVTQEIRQNQKTRDLPIVLVTAYGNEVAEKGIKLGANDFLAKPINIDCLISKIEVLIA